MDVGRGEQGWWWLDARRQWRCTRFRVVAWWRARAARREELRIEAYGPPARWK